MVSLSKKPSDVVKGQVGENLRVAHGRLTLVMVCFALVFIALGLRAADVSLMATSEYGYQAEVQKLVSEYRGDILDRNGVLLATTLDVQSLYADSKHIQSPRDTALKLKAVFPDLSLSLLQKRLESGDRFVWLKRDVRPQDKARVYQIGEPGLKFRSEKTRVYPHAHLFSHLVGYTDIDEKGVVGIERGLNDILASGEHVTLSLDTRLQHILRRSLVNAAKSFEAKSGAGTIIDVRTGEIVAGVSWPDFDPHHPGAIEGKAGFNNLTLGVFELGSMFKIFSTAALLEMHDVPMDEEFDAREPIKVGRFRINDFHAEERVLSVPEVFMYSSNIGSALMGQRVGTDGLKGFYSDLGLMDRMDLEIKEIGKPIIPSPWREVNTLTASYGHGIATSPLQMTAAVASIINEGNLIRPTLLKVKVGSEEPQVRPNISIVSPETSENIRQLMRLVVSDGTGRKANVKGYQVGGKTGTAEKIGASGYDRSRLISSFVGAFPSHEPRYVVMVMIDEPKGQRHSYGYATAGWVAAPAIAEIVSSMADVLGLVPDDAMDSYASGLKRFVTFEEGGGYVSH